MRPLLWRGFCSACRHASRWTANSSRRSARPVCNPRTSLPRPLGPIASWPTPCVTASRGAHPFVRDVTLANSTFGNRYVHIAAPHLGVHALGGGIGQGVAMAVGAALAGEPAKTIALVGDGGTMVNLGELATVVDTKADIAFILMNDRGYGVIRNIQDAQFSGRRHYADLHTPDFGLLCAALGLPHQRVSNIEQFEAALDRALAK